MAAFKYQLTIAYDGTRYCGWQVQKEGITIQEVLQKKLGILLQEESCVVGAGRTDAGVHALGQTAHFSTDNKLDLYRFLHSLNQVLPEDIRVLHIQRVPNTFHARYSATAKEYHYHLDLGRAQVPFKRLYSWHLPGQICLNLLRSCANFFVGTIDFTSFVNTAKPGATIGRAVRTMNRITIVPEKNGVRIEFEAEGFLYKMVRNLTGTMVEVASGKRNLDEIPAILHGRDRRLAGRAAPAKGLFLMRVVYGQMTSNCESKSEDVQKQTS